MILSLSKTPNLENEIINFIFHWISEFGTAGALILAGLLINRESKKSEEIYYFATGLLMNAVIGMIIYYIIFTEIIFIVMGFVIISISIYLGMQNYDKLRDVYFFAMGAILYGLLNIFGIGVRELNISILVYLGVALLLGIILIILSFKNEVNIEKLK